MVAIRSGGLRGGKGAKGRMESFARALRYGQAVDNRSHAGVWEEGT